MILAYFSNIESKLEEGIDEGGKKKTKKKNAIQLNFFSLLSFLEKND